MVDITEKSTSLRYAKAQAIVKVSHADTIKSVVEKKVPKGDVFEFAKVAGLFAVKKTSEIIPDCHPLPVEYTGISYEIEGLEIKIFVEVKTIYRTGVEVEAMHGASVVALTMYDMLKPIDKGVEIHHIKLVEKTGGKSDFKANEQVFKAGLILYSNGIVSGKKEDKVSQTIDIVLQKQNITLAKTWVVEEDLQQLLTLLASAEAAPYELIIVAGGTGISPKDQVPKALQQRFDIPANSLMEAARIYGLERDFKAMLSEGVAGLIGNQFVINIPGSSNGALETITPIAKGLRKILENNNYTPKR